MAEFLLPPAVWCDGGDVADFSPGAMSVAAPAADPGKCPLDQIRRIIQIRFGSHRHIEIFVHSCRAEHARNALASNQQVGHFSDDFCPFGTWQQADSRLAMDERVLKCENDIP